MPTSLRPRIQETQDSIDRHRHSSGSSHATEVVRRIDPFAPTPSLHPEKVRLHDSQWPATTKSHSSSAGAYRYRLNNKSPAREKSEKSPYRQSIPDQSRDSMCADESTGC